MELGKIQNMLACLARSKTLVASMGRWLDLIDQERELRAVYTWYTIVAQHLERWGELPNASQVQAASMEVINTQWTDLDVPQRQFCMIVCSQALATLATITDDSKAESVGKELLSAFLRERVSIDYGRRLQSPNAPVDVLSRKMAEDLAKIDGTIGTTFEDIFPEEWFPTGKGSALTPIGINFIDIMLGGGLLAGEAVGHLAPINKGKTTLAHQVCYSRASTTVRPRLVEAGKEGRIPDFSALPITYFFAYERVENLLPSIISNAASIPRDLAAAAYEAAALGKENPLRSSASRTWGDYELKEYAAQFAEAEAARRAGTPDAMIRYPAGEMERFKHATRVINAVWRIVDFSGGDRSLMAYAADGVAGMAEYIDAHQQAIGRPGVDFVCVDFVGAAAVRAATKISGGRSSDSFKREFVQMYPDVISLQIANHYRCPVWLSHQLNPEENKRPPGSVPNPMNAEASSMFLEFCAAGFASGVLTSENIAVFKVGKSRRKSLGDIELQLGYLEKRYARWSAAEGYKIYDNKVEPARNVYDPSGSSSGGIPPGGGFGG